MKELEYVEFNIKIPRYKYVSKEFSNRPDYLQQQALLQLKEENAKLKQYNIDYENQLFKSEKKNTELKQKLSSIEELTNKNSVLIYDPEEDSDISYIASERVLEILRGNNNEMDN